MSTPDGIEPIVGWRFWYYPRWSSIPALRSFTQPARLLPRQAMHARCTRIAGHEAPKQGCTCGIYAVDTELTARKYASAPETGYVRVIGEVSLWGRVVVGEHGWRAEYAYPRRLIILGPKRIRNATLDRIERELSVFGVPVEVERHIEPECVRWRDDWVFNLLVLVLYLWLFLGIAAALIMGNLMIGAFVGFLFYVGPRAVMAALDEIRRRRRGPAATPPVTRAP